MLIQGHNKQPLHNIVKTERKITEIEKSVCNCKNKNLCPQN